MDYITYLEVALLIYLCAFTFIGLVGSIIRKTKARYVSLIFILIFAVVAYSVRYEVSFYEIDYLYALILFLLLILIFITVHLGLGIRYIHQYLGSRWKNLWIILVTPFLGFIFVLYIAVYPLDGYYIDEFSRRMGYHLSSDAVVLKKSASYPDFHGDYSSEAVIRLSKTEFEKIIKKFPPSPSGRGCFNSVSSSYLGVDFTPTGCWSKKIKSDARIMVTYFSNDSALHFYFSQT